MQSSHILDNDNMPFVSVAVYKKGVSNHCFNQINKLYPNSSIYIICPKCDINKFELLDLKNTLVIDENDLIENINKEYVFKLMNFNYCKKSHDHSKRNWYWQQILKLCCCFNAIIPNKYIIIDSDFIILSKIKFYNNKAIFNKSLISIEWDQLYIEKFIKYAVGIDTVKHGYISEYMLFEKNYVKEMLSVFGRSLPDIIHNLMDILSNNDAYDLAEYAWYANFMFKNYPNKVTTQSIYYYRLVHKYYGHSIRKYELAIFKKIWKLDAVCVESLWGNDRFLITPIYKFISYLRYKFNYYGRLPFSVIPKKDPAWVYNIAENPLNPLMLKIYLKLVKIYQKYPLIRKIYRRIRSQFCSK